VRSLWAITKKEIISYFLSPIAYVIIAVFLAISGYFFSVILFATHLADLRGILGNMAVTFLFMAPILTMRSLAEERKLGTDELLMTSPVSITAMVAGKYLAALAVYGVILLLSLTYPIILLYLASPDLGPIISGYLGLVLMGGAFIAVGIFASSLSENQIVAGIIGFGLLLLFWMVGWMGSTMSDGINQVLSSLSLVEHYNDFEKGILDSSHLLFYISFIFTFLFLTIRVIDSRRWS